MDVDEQQAKADLMVFLRGSSPLRGYWEDCRKLLGKCASWLADKESTLPISLLATVAIQDDLQRMQYQCILLLPAGDLFRQARQEAPTNPTAALAYNTLGAIQHLVGATAPGLSATEKQARIKQVQEWIAAAKKVRLALH